jgi:hypothetical protein
VVLIKPGGLGEKARIPFRMLLNSGATSERWLSTREGCLLQSFDTASSYWAGRHLHGTRSRLWDLIRYFAGCGPAFRLRRRLGFRIETLASGFTSPWSNLFQGSIYTVVSRIRDKLSPQLQGKVAGVVMLELEEEPSR